MPPFFYIRHNIYMKDYSNYISIIGAGIGGLALGNILKKNDIPCVIFEKSEKISEYGAGISISPNGLKVLEKLDLDERFKEVSAQPGYAVFHSNNEIITEISTNVVTSLRKNLHNILLENYLALDGEILFNHELVDLDLTDKNIYFSNNIKSNVNHIAACDGIRSICQKKLSTSNSKPEYSGYSVWRTIMPSHQKKINFHLGSNFHVVSYPVDQNKISLIAAIKDKNKFNESWKEKGSLEDLFSTIPSSIIDMYPTIKDSNEIYKWGVYIRPKIESLYNNNITFIGDSAHPIVPFLGQGGCLALEDAYIFGNLLNKYKNNFNKAQNKYQQVRIKRIKSINNQSLNQAKLNHLSNPLLIFIRNMLMKYTNIILSRTKNIWSYDISKIIDV